MFLNHEYVAKDGRKYRNGIQYWPPREVKFTANSFGTKLADKWCISDTKELEVPEEEEDQEVKPKKNLMAMGALGALANLLKKKKAPEPEPVPEATANL